MPLRRRFGGVLFNGSPPRARRMEFERILSGELSGIRFCLDDKFASELTVNWKEAGGAPDPSEANALAMALAGQIAQHALPHELVGLRCGSAEGDDAFRRILEMLYDIRCFCDETTPRDSPRLRGPRTQGNGQGATEAPAHRVLVLLSGGFDSALSALLLIEAGFEVEALHVRVNRHVEDLEESAARRVTSILGIPLSVVEVRSEDEERIGRYYSRTFGIYPFYNSVPHGRDFPLALIAALIAKRRKCGAIAFGHEKESRSKVLRYKGRNIFRHDVESAYGFDLVKDFADSQCGFKTEFFSPIAGLSIYQVRRIMMERFSEVTRELQSCFWARSCGRCLKCVSTYAMRRHLGAPAVENAENPFADEGDEDMALFAMPDRPSTALGYGPQMHFVMNRLIQSGDVHPEDYWLKVFKRQGRMQLSPPLEAIERICLDVDEPDEVPESVRQVINSLVR